MMGKETIEFGTIQMFVSTRNVTGSALVFVFVVAVTGYILSGQHMRQRQGSHNLINDSTHHPSGHSSTQFSCRFEMDVQFICLGSQRKRSSAWATNESHLGTLTITGALPSLHTCIPLVPGRAQASVFQLLVWSGIHNQGGEVLP
jgi:hypothetical protein